jgi:ribonuclease T2
MSSASATSSGGSLSGKGYLNVINSGSQDGCLISAGTWYVSGTCATYTAAPSGKSCNMFSIQSFNRLIGSGFTLTSSKGKCAISNGEFTCSSSVSTATVFTTLSGYIAYSGQPNFYVTAVAQGQTQQTVYTTSHSVTIQIKWQAQ